MTSARAQFGLDEKSQREIVCVQGLGFVGAAMAAAVASARDSAGNARYDVIGVELDSPEGRARAQRLNDGEFPFVSPDPKISDAIARACKIGNLVATTNAAAFALAKVAIVDVHLDVTTNEHGEPVAALDGFDKAVRTLGRHLLKESLVIVETTVPPGTCHHLVAPVLEEELRARGLSKDALLLAHSYERVMPGPDYFDSIVNFWRVYAGHTAKAADACRDFLSTVVNVDQYPLRRLGSTTASELGKVLENSYRAINIAIIEEWARFAEIADVDLFEVIGAIRDRPTHANIKQPGFGVGGYCLTKDPLFAEAASRQFLKTDKLLFPFCRSAIAVNQRMPIVNLDRIEQIAGGISGKSILLLGVAYRSEVDDTRYSPAEIFYREAIGRGARLLCHDPFVREWKELGLSLPNSMPKASEFDIVVFAVPHRLYRELDVTAWLGSARPFIYDCDNVLSDDTRGRLRAVGLQIESTGRGIGL